MMPPTNKEAQHGQQQLVVDKLQKAIADKDLKENQETANELLQDNDSVTVIAAALSLLTQERKNVPVKLSSIQPISVRGRGGQGGGNRRNNQQRDKGKSGQGGRNQGGRNQGGRNQGGRSRKANFDKRRSRD